MLIAEEKIVGKLFWKPEASRQHFAFNICIKKTVHLHSEDSSGVLC